MMECGVHATQAMRLHYAVLLPGLLLAQGDKQLDSWQSLLQKSRSAYSQHDLAAQSLYAEQAWAAVRRVGPSSADYVDGVDGAANELGDISGGLTAERIYSGALAASSGAASRDVHMRLLLRLGEHLEGLSQEVKAARIYSEAVDMEKSAPDLAKFYGYTLVRLAYVKEKLGLPQEAEKLYRVAAAEPPADRSLANSHRMVAFRISYDEPNPQDFVVTLGRFLQRFNRIEEAETVYKDAIAHATNGEKKARMLDYAWFLRADDRRVEALSEYWGIIAIDRADTSKGGRNALRNDLSNLAVMEQQTGNYDGALSVLRELVDSGRQEGLSSGEYQNALGIYASHLLQTGNLGAAGAVIDEEVSISSTNVLPMALSQRVEWLRAKGDTAAAEALQKQIADTRARYSAPPNPLDDVQKLVEEGRQLVLKRQLEPAGRLIEEVFSRLSSDYVSTFFRPLEPVASAFCSLNMKEEAAEIMMRQVTLLERQEGADRPAFAQTLLQTSIFFVRERMPEIARELIDRAALIISRTGGEECVAMELVYDRRWDLLSIDGKYDGAMEQANKLLQLRVRIHGENSQSVLETERQIGRYLVRANRAGEAKVHYQRAAEISRRLHDGRGVEHVKTLGAIASQLADSRLFDDALGLVDESYEIAKGFRDPQLAQLLVAQRADVVARSQRENKLP
jgi:tetratricopeptide (TPR) repeat protein